MALHDTREAARPPVRERAAELRRCLRNQRCSLAAASSIRRCSRSDSGCCSWVGGRPCSRSAAALRCASIGNHDVGETVGDQLERLHPVGRVDDGDREPSDLGERVE
jgi:hypothetical protein